VSLLLQSLTAVFALAGQSGPSDRVEGSDPFAWARVSWNKHAMTVVICRDQETVATLVDGPTKHSHSAEEDLKSAQSLCDGSTRTIWSQPCWARTPIEALAEGFALVNIHERRSQSDERSTGQLAVHMEEIERDVICGRFTYIKIRQVLHRRRANLTKHPRRFRSRCDSTSADLSRTNCLIPLCTRIGLDLITVNSTGAQKG